MDMKEIYLAAGCFWGAEHYLKCIRGVVRTETGYANGNISHPTYREVYTDSTGYAETVHVVYDPAVLGLERLIQIYFKAIDPTSLNRQGEDEGTRYRTGIYYSDPADLPAIRRIYERVEGETKEPLAVEVKPLKNFYRAEDFHQDYLEKNPQGYCHISPALMEFARQANESDSDTD
ncbi:MAG: peptide-methionine (S)-S-oxide reductase MsrA [Bacteroidales bacterium]|jgi:methionine-S-sulfoxide reductase|nr:peptide-methionine (S)-S-oxide reductase MsrA [Bacteroidales bacterium]